MAVRFPAEWEPQSGVMLTWPHPATDWADTLDDVYPVFVEIGAAIARREGLLNVCHSVEHLQRVRDLLVARTGETANIRFAIAPSDDTWARDHGPLTTLQDGQPQLENFVFNGWGGKFTAEMDNALTPVLSDRRVFGGLPMQSHDIVLEGGALETDGQGTLLATRSSVLTSTRNPGLDEATMESLLARVLGIERCLWLDHGDISGDDTDGHIDTLARFSDSETILYASAPAGDRDHPELSAMEDELRGLRTQKGKPYRLLPLPFPGEHRDEEGRRVPATYANFLIINGAVLLPIYGVAADREAQAVLEGAFPSREIVPIDCRAIIRQNGSLHCLTMQFPAGVELRDSEEILKL